MGSGIRYLPTHPRTMRRADSRSTLCPIDTNMGLVPSRVLSAAPITSSPSLSSAREPLARPGSSNLPVSLDLAHPMVGMSKRRPRWQAMPNRLGWAIPWPSTSKDVGPKGKALQDGDQDGGLPEGEQARHVGKGDLRPRDPAFYRLQSRVAQDHYSRRGPSIRASP